jgi:hypothetical protein
MFGAPPLGVVVPASGALLRASALPGLLPQVTIGSTGSQSLDKKKITTTPILPMIIQLAAWITNAVLSMSRRAPGQGNTDD